MKRYGWILVLLLLMNIGCDPVTRDVRRMIEEANALLETNPDSTLMLIDSVMRMEANLRESERMEMALLQGHALYGGSICDDKERPMLDKVVTLPELDIASDYYAERKEYGKAMLTAYYSGHSLLEAGDKASAMESFKKAEQYGNIVGDSLTVARAQYQMGKMLFDDFMEAESIVVLKNADSKFGDHEDERAFVKNLEAIAYIMTQKYDSAELLLNQGLECAEKGKSIHAKQKVLNNYAVFYRLQGNYEKALECLRQIDIKDSKDSERLLLHLNMGNIFNQMGVLDSTSFQYKQMKEILVSNPDVKDDTKISAYAALSRFAENQGDVSLALEYRKQYESLANEIQLQIERKNIYRIQRKYDYEAIRNVLNTRLIKTHIIILIISVILFIAVIILFILKNRQNVLLLEKKDMKQQFEDLKKEFSHTIKSDDLDKIVASQLRILLLANHIQKRSKDPQHEWKPLVDRLMEGKDNIYEAAVAIIEVAYPDLHSTMKEKFTGLSETEFRVCLLSFFGLSNSEMADLLGLRLNTVNQNRSTLRKKLNLESKNIKEQLHSVLSK